MIFLIQNVCRYEFKWIPQYLSNIKTLDKIIKHILKLGVN